MADRTRPIGIVTVALVLVVVAVLVLRGGESFELKVEFSDASGLVKGSPVQIGGDSVGDVDELELTDDGQAVVTLDLEEDLGLREGTRAQIRAVGLAGIANRIVELDNGPEDAAPLDDGATLRQERTGAYVDLDTLLNTLDAKARGRLQRVLRSGTNLARGDRPRQFNGLLRELPEALTEAQLLAAELAREPAQTERLLLTGAATAGALASRRDDLARGVRSTATTLRTLADESDALDRTISRAPGLLTRARGTLHDLRTLLAVTSGTARLARPAVAPLTRVLRDLPPTARLAAPLARRLAGLTPSLRATLRGLPPLARTAVPAFTQAERAIDVSGPIFSGLRQYTPDVISGLFLGLGGAASYYDANGKMVRAQLGVPGDSGVLSVIADLQSRLGGGYNGRDARCAGSAEIAAADGSSPFVDDPALCDPKAAP